jgi:hypothetical protein
MITCDKTLSIYQRGLWHRHFQKAIFENCSDRLFLKETGEAEGLLWLRGGGGGGRALRGFERRPRQTRIMSTTQTRIAYLNQNLGLIGR